MGMNPVQWAVKPYLDMVCSVTSDSDAIALAKYITMAPGGQAALHLDAYLAGTGIPMWVDLDRVLRTDQGVREEILRGIIAARKEKRTSGTIPIPQHVYANLDWQFAIGGMNIDWRAIPNTNKVFLSFKNKYRWHPNEQRVSQCIHRAAENMKMRGAKDYMMSGETTIVVTETDVAGRTWGFIKNRM